MSPRVRPATQNLIDPSLHPSIVRRVKKLLSEQQTFSTAPLTPFVRKMLERRDNFLATAAEHGTACYLFDTEALKESLDAFAAAFARPVPDLSVFYAVKVNDYPPLLRKIVEYGYGLDVSSERELQLGLAAGASRMVFTGPAKSAQALERALAHADTVTINMDSFHELAVLGELTTQRKRTVRAGIRVNGAHTASWNKFGIPLTELRRFYDLAQAYPFLSLTGIHVHQSWNKDASPYANTMEEVGEYLREHFTEAERAAFTFFDFGGGFAPHRLEGEYAWLQPQGEVVKAAYEYFGEEAPFTRTHITYETVPLPTYARGIGAAITKHLRKVLPNATYYTEPGRILVNSAMHVLLRVADLKEHGIVILDGGTNIVGWERFEVEYFPVINLTHPSLKEKEAKLYGSLCMMQDVWGYGCYASKMEIGDVILVPYQGALTYSLMQDFIHGRARVVTL